MRRLSRLSNQKPRYDPVKPFSLRKKEKKIRNRLIFSLFIGLILLYGMFVWILPNLIGGLSVFNQLKTNNISPTPMPKNAILAPPTLDIPYESTFAAVIKIKGYSQPNTLVEIYQNNLLLETKRSVADGSFISKEINLVLGTNSFYGRNIDEKGEKSLPSKTFQIIYDNEKPKINLTEPAEGQIIKGDKKVKVSGSVDKNRDIDLTINGIRIIINSDGNFSQTIDISDGDNIITVLAADLAGNTSQVSRKVTYQP